VATLTRELSYEEAMGHVAKIRGMEVSHTWLGYVAALFLELGELRVQEGAKHPEGSVTIMLDTEWRHGIGGFALIDRNDELPDIERHVRALVGSVVETITISRDDFSLEIAITGGRWIRSPGCRWDESSSWTIFLGDGRWITVENQSLCIQRGVDSLDTGETV
jgi:hypothetical protein